MLPMLQYGQMHARELEGRRDRLSFRPRYKVAHLRGLEDCPNALAETSAARRSLPILLGSAAISARSSA